MIYPLGGLFFGALLGAYRAKSRRGKTAGVARWAPVFATISAIMRCFVAILITRNLTY